MFKVNFCKQNLMNGMSTRLILYL